MVTVEVAKEVEITEAMVRVVCATGQNPHEFEDHTLYLNKGMEDLLELNETRTEIILPRSNKTIWARTPLALMGTKMNIMTEPLH